MPETPLVKILSLLRSMIREDEFSVNLVGSAINCFMLSFFTKSLYFAVTVTVTEHIIIEAS